MEHRQEGSWQSLEEEPTQQTYTGNFIILRVCARGKIIGHVVVSTKIAIPRDVDI